MTRTVVATLPTRTPRKMTLPMAMRLLMGLILLAAPTPLVEQPMVTVP